jgi:hypothetical protein
MFLLCIVIDEKVIAAGRGKVFVNCALPITIGLSDMVCTNCGRV